MLVSPEASTRIALWTAKLTFGTLLTLRKFFDNDLDMANVAFALALRSRLDLPHARNLAPQNAEESLESMEKLMLTSSLYEVSITAGIDRATARRKLNKLRDLGYVARREDGRWELIDFHDPNNKSDAVAALKSLLKLYLTGIKELQEHVPVSGLEMALEQLEEVAPPSNHALNEDEFSMKLKKHNS